MATRPPVKPPTGPKPGSPTGTGISNGNGTNSPAPPVSIGVGYGVGGKGNPPPKPPTKPPVVGGGNPPVGGQPKPPTPAPPPPSTNPIDALSGSQRDAYAFLVDEFNQFGLGSLAPTIFNFIKQGYGADTISLLLQDTPEYKARFAGNELRAKAGLGVLSPAQYLSLESSYRQILANAGLPKNFYDKPEDFAKWIGGDVSPTELQNRVNLEVNTVAQAPAEVKQALTDLYGVSQGDMVAYFLDQSRAVPLLQLQAQAAQIGGQALMRGLSDANANRLAQLGVTASQAATGYGQIGESLNTLQQIASRFGTGFSQTEAENAVFTPGGQATLKQRSLEEQEKALFSGNTGATSYIGLNAGTQQQ